MVPEGLLDPLPAAPPEDEELGELELGVLLDEDPPLAWSFFSLVDEFIEALPDALPDGVAVEELGEELLEPADDEAPGVVDGDVEGVVVLLDEAPVAARSLLPARSQAVSRVAPSARETATAIVCSLICPPWLGYLN